MKHDQIMFLKQVSSVISPTLSHGSIFNKLLSKPKWQAYIGPMLAQRSAPNATRSC